MTKNQMQAIVDVGSSVRPRIDFFVTILTGKHKGKSGLVFWHGENPYENPYRYGSAASNLMTQAMGIHGFRIGVKTNNGKKFFTKAEDLVKWDEATQQYIYGTQPDNPPQAQLDKGNNHGKPNMGHHPKGP